MCMLNNQNTKYVIDPTVHWENGTPYDISPDCVSPTNRPVPVLVSFLTDDEQVNHHFGTFTNMCCWLTVYGINIMVSSVGLQTNHSIRYA